MLLQFRSHSKDDFRRIENSIVLFREWLFPSLDEFENSELEAKADESRQIFNAIVTHAIIAIVEVKNVEVLVSSKLFNSSHFS